MSVTGSYWDLWTDIKHMHLYIYILLIKNCYVVTWFSIIKRNFSKTFNSNQIVYIFLTVTQILKLTEKCHI